MKILRVIAPFLFARNWYTGEFELSSPRLILFSALFLLLALAVWIVLLQPPLEYQAS